LRDDFSGSKVKVEQLVRYPVKGLGPEYLECVEVEKGGSIPYDRVFAIAHGATEFDAGSPAYLRKQHFLMLMSNPRLAAMRTKFLGESGQLSATLPDGRTFNGCLRDEGDRRQLEALLADYIGEESRGGPPRIVSADGHRFFDMPNELLSLINLQSVADLGRAVGAKLDPIRFRGNAYVSGLGAWEEKRLVGSTVECGDLEFRVVQEISRCQATCVNPTTAEVDVNVPFELRQRYGTLNMGLYLSVVRGGTICAGQDLHFHS
jgi:hypothetical protein